MGYPSHWLLEVLTAIIEDEITTTARPPRKSPTTSQDAVKDYPERKLCTTPFSSEIATLTLIFRQLLPFSITSTPIPNRDAIHKYTFQMPRQGNFPNVGSARLVLVFFEDSIVETIYAGANEKTIIALTEGTFSQMLILDPGWEEVEPRW
ncbi:hypothetical protein BDZ45DRAFT_775793 [Acephala macrosclerotiorum]|nr:hypothetical protein BDZ45DRAFT_775793 [Acephala macrosclerotiorum]